MKTSQFNLAGRYITVGFSLLTAACLCSCQSALYLAAARGDAKVVQRELARATTEERNQAADIAYRKGHTAVLKEMAKVGVAIAPQNIINKELILNKIWEGTDENEIAGGLDENTTFSQFWPSVQLKMKRLPEDFIYKLTWDGANPKQYSFIEKVPIFGTGLPMDCENSLRQLYKRRNYNTAEVFYSHKSSGYCTTQRFFLKFDSPSTGTYWEIATMNPLYIGEYSKGRFHIQKSPIPAKSAKNVKKKKRRK